MQLGVGWQRVDEGRRQRLGQHHPISDDVNGHLDMAQVVSDNEAGSLMCRCKVDKAVLCFGTINTIAVCCIGCDPASAPF